MPKQKREGFEEKKKRMLEKDEKIINNKCYTEDKILVYTIYVEKFYVENIPKKAVSMPKICWKKNLIYLQYN